MENRQENSSQLPYSPITAEEARVVLMNMEVGISGLENDLEYYLLLEQVNSLMGNLIHRRKVNAIYKCEIIRLPDNTGSLG